MKHLVLITALMSGALVTSEARQASQDARGAQASATLIDSSGRAVGQARLRQTEHGVLLQLDLTNATPGIHALHIHETGRCDRPTFESAGGHFAPGGRAHGFFDPKGPHAGDLPNIHVPASLTLSLEFFVNDVTLAPGPRSLLDADASAIVMHAGGDDYVSEPAGAAGERLACGQIVGQAPRGGRSNSNDR